MSDPKIMICPAKDICGAGWCAQKEPHAFHENCCEGTWDYTGGAGCIQSVAEGYCPDCVPYVSEKGKTDAG